MNYIYEGVSMKYIRKQDSYYRYFYLFIFYCHIYAETALDCICIDFFCNFLLVESILFSSFNLAPLVNYILSCIYKHVQIKTCIIYMFIFIETKIYTQIIKKYIYQIINLISLK